MMVEEKVIAVLRFVLTDTKLQIQNNGYGGLSINDHRYLTNSTFH
jgi:hypothetical protein